MTYQPTEIVACAKEHTLPAHIRALIEARPYIADFIDISAPDATSRARSVLNLIDSVLDGYNTRT